MELVQKSQNKQHMLGSQGESHIQSCHIIYFKCSTDNYTTYKETKSVIHTQEAQLLDLFDKELKSAILNIFKKPRNHVLSKV